jgi:hypothetical protein
MRIGIVAVQMPALVRRLAVAVLFLCGLFFMTTAVEISVSTPAKADACVCPAGSQIGNAGGALYCFNPTTNATTNCGASSNPEKISKINRGLWGIGSEVVFIPVAQLGPPPLDFGSVAQGGSGVHLGMYASPDGSNAIGGLANGFGYSGKAVGLSDTSGALAGTTTPSYHGSGGGGQIFGSVDVAPNLQLGGMFNYQQYSSSFSDGSTTKTDEYLFTGYFQYLFGQRSYVQGLGTYGSSPTSLFNASTGGTASFGGNIAAGKLIVGHVFTLIDPGSATTSAIIAKAPPKASGFGLLLDMSAYGGYVTGHNDGYTESTGLAMGNFDEHFGQIGGTAKLTAVVPLYGLVWQPFIQGSVEQWLGFRAAQYVPAQAGVAADTVFLNEATTFFGGRIGVSTNTRSGWEFGVYGFDMTSSDLNFAGGTGYAKLHF